MCQLTVDSMLVLTVKQQQILPFISFLAFLSSDVGNWCVCVCVCVCVCLWCVGCACVCAQLCLTHCLYPTRIHGLYPTRLLCPWDFQGKNTGMGCHFLRQGIFQTQRLNQPLLRLLRWQKDSLPLRHLLYVNQTLFLSAERHIASVAMTIFLTSSWEGKKQGTAPIAFLSD